jgi:hypothetical protein
MHEPPVFESPAFDMHTPFDAPARLREMQRAKQAERNREYLRSPEFRAIVRGAFERMKSK